jgi:hypothetical protein
MKNGFSSTAIFRQVYSDYKEFFYIKNKKKVNHGI